MTVELGVKRSPVIPSTNALESMIEICRDHNSNMKRWHDGQY